LRNEEGGGRSEEGGVKSEGKHGIRKTVRENNQREKKEQVS